MNGKRMVLVFLLVAAMLLGGCDNGFFQEFWQEMSSPEKQETELVDFLNMTYTRPDLEELIQLEEKIEWE